MIDEIYDKENFLGNFPTSPPPPPDLGGGQIPITRFSEQIRHRASRRTFFFSPETQRRIKESKKKAQTKRAFKIKKEIQRISFFSKTDCKIES
ncbi:hypothetical protein CH370_14115 [Leptospira kmetyi]|nr:hypothetical protein CH370_14115 [Leptospira kmetyi]